MCFAFTKSNKKNPVNKPAKNPSKKDYVLNYPPPIRVLSKSESFLESNATSKDNGFEDSSYVHYQIIANRRCAIPKWTLNSSTMFDMQQGGLGDCWLIAAIAGLAEVPNLMNFVLQVDHNEKVIQRYSATNHSECFKIMLFVNNNWQPIMVRPTLPVNYCNKPKYCNFGQDSVDCHGIDIDQLELWPCFLEKALAIVMGSYEKLDGGLSKEAAYYLSGGMSRNLKFTDSHRLNSIKQFNFFKKVMDEGARVFFAVTNYSLLNSGFCEYDNNICAGHAYAVKGFYKVKIEESGETEYLAAVYNPHGGNEWKNMPFNDDDEIWKSPRMVRNLEKCGVKNKLKNEGFFYLRFSDLLSVSDWFDWTRIPSEFMSKEKTNVHYKSLTQCLPKNKKPTLPTFRLPQFYNPDLHKMSYHFYISKKSELLIELAIKDYRMKKNGCEMIGFKVLDKKCEDKANVLCDKKPELFSCGTNLCLKAGSYWIVPVIPKFHRLKQDLEVYVRIWKRQF